MPLRRVSVTDVKVGMATIPARQSSAQQVLDSLAGHHVYVTFNGFHEIPAWADDYYITPRLEPGNVGDRGKFLFPQEGYCFTIDDDIIYPENYLARTIDSIEKHGNKIVGYHGKLVVGNNPLSFPVRHFRLDLAADEKVDFLGTGVMAWRSSDITFPEEIFTLYNDADTNVAVHAKKQGVGMVCLAHTSRTFKPIFHNHNIWDSAAKRKEETMEKLREAF